MSLEGLPITEGSIGAAIVFFLFKMNQTLTFMKTILLERLPKK